MHIKYSPRKSDRDTAIECIDENTISIDGEEHDFDVDSVSWPEIAAETNGAILEAHREDGELCLTVLRFYKESCSEWDNSQYNEVTA